MELTIYRNHHRLDRNAYAVAREIIFPDGVPVRMLESPLGNLEKDDFPVTRVHEETTTEAEGGLANEELQFRDQARASRTPEEGMSLLKEYF